MNRSRPQRFALWGSACRVQVGSPEYHRIMYIRSFNVRIVRVTTVFANNFRESINRADRAMRKFNEAIERSLR
jgi:hypothetical protein